METARIRPNFTLFLIFQNIDGFNRKVESADGTSFLVFKLFLQNVETLNTQ